MLKRDFLDQIQSKNPRFTFVQYRTLAKQVGVNPDAKELTDDEVERLTAAYEGRTPAGAQGTPGDVDSSAALAKVAQGARANIQALALQGHSAVANQGAMIRAAKDRMIQQETEAVLAAISPEACQQDFVLELARKSTEMLQQYQQMPQGESIAGLLVSEDADWFDCIYGEVVEDGDHE